MNSRQAIIVDILESADAKPENSMHRGRHFGIDRAAGTP